MMNDLCAQARDLLPAYSIGATTDEETHFVESQIADCPELAHELRDYQALSDKLLRDVPQFAPPPRLLNNLLAAASVQTAPVAVSTPRPEMNASTPPVPLPTAPKRMPSRLPVRLGYGLAAAFLLALIGSNVYWFVQINRLEGERQRLYTEYARLERDLASQNVSFEAMRAPDTRWARMASPLDESGTAPQPQDPYAWIVWSPSREDGVLMAQNFPAPPAQSVYQLWGHQGGMDVSLSTFGVDETGGALLYVDEQAWNFERFWITTEPAGGSASPSGEPFVRVRLNS